jgi:hypothetical protein
LPSAVLRAGDELLVVDGHHRLTIQYLLDIPASVCIVESFQDHFKQKDYKHVSELSLYDSNYMIFSRFDRLLRDRSEVSCLGIRDFDALIRENKDIIDKALRKRVA